MAESQLDTSVYWAAKMGAPEESIDKIREDFNSADIENRFSFSGLLLSFGIGLIFYAIGAVIVALIAKKDPAETI